MGQFTAPLRKVREPSAGRSRRRTAPLAASRAVADGLRTVPSPFNAAVLDVNVTFGCDVLDRERPRSARVTIHYYDIGKFAFW